MGLFWSLERLCIRYMQTLIWQNLNYYYKYLPIFIVIASTGWWVDLCHSYLINNVPRTAAGEHPYPINTRDSYRPFDVVPAEIKLRLGVLISDIIIPRRNHIQENICYFARFMSAMELGESFLICWRSYSRQLKGRQKGRHLHISYLNILSLMKIISFRFKFHWTLKWIIVALDKSLKLIKWQAIMWINFDIVYWRLLMLILIIQPQLIRIRWFISYDCHTSPIAVVLAASGCLYTPTV